MQYEFKKTFILEIGNPLALVSGRKPVERGVVMKILDNRHAHLPAHSESNESKDITELKEKLK